MRPYRIAMDKIAQAFGAAARDRVEDTIEQALEAGVPWNQIVIALLLSLLSGGGIEAVIAAILALIKR